MAAEFKDVTGALTVLKPDHAVVDQAVILVLSDPDSFVDNICFVLGLGGGRISTWKKGEVFWPYNLLARDILEARIVVWRSNADLGHFLSPVSTNRIKDHATSLSSALSSLRDSPVTSTCPIVFVAHSLGGIICALVRCRSRATVAAADCLVPGLLYSSVVEPDDAEKLSDHTAALALMCHPF